MCLLFPLPIMADQCALVPGDVAMNAYEILLDSSEYTYFCAPCLDTEPISKPIDTVEIHDKYYKPINDVMYEIYINNKPIYLSYVYVNGINLVMQANCTPIEDVPKSIEDFTSGRWQLKMFDQ